MMAVRSILVVDDDPLLCRIMARTLVEEGHQVYTAENGEEGLVKACQLGMRLALVITDVRMPVMDGLELAGHLARLDPAPPVLFVSGGAGFEGCRGPCSPSPSLPKRW